MTAFREGDRVRITKYSKTLNGELGTVSFINGFYIYVYPDCQPDNTRYPIELYSSELEMVKEIHHATE
jgi:hypothetical protein